MYVCACGSRMGMIKSSSLCLTIISTISLTLFGRTSFRIHRHQVVCCVETVEKGFNEYSVCSASCSELNHSIRLYAHAHSHHSLASDVTLFLASSARFSLSSSSGIVGSCSSFLVILGANA